LLRNVLKIPEERALAVVAAIGRVGAVARIVELPGFDEAVANPDLRSAIATASRFSRAAKEAERAVTARARSPSASQAA
jgi:hypothetical protein